MCFCLMKLPKSSIRTLKSQSFSSISGNVAMFPFVLKKGPYILIWAYNELNPIHWAQTPNRDIAARRKAFRVSVHAIHSPRLCKVVSTVMVLYCDWSSGVTAGKSMGFFERQNRCRCVHLSLLQAFLSMHLNLSFMSKSVLSMLKQVSSCPSCHRPPPHRCACHTSAISRYSAPEPWRSQL